MKQIKFYSTTGDYGCFSNFSHHSAKIDGKVWPTSEHYFQAKKFDDPEYAEKIRKAKTPAEAASLGRSRKVKIKDNWDNIRDSVMYKAVLAKFSQNYEIKQILLSTEDSILIEHTYNDSYWGDGGDGSGKNKLGKTLMQVRQLLSQEDNYSSEK